MVGSAFDLVCNDCLVNPKGFSSRSLSLIFAEQKKMDS